MDRGSKFCAAALALIVASGIASRVLWSQSATSSHPATISDQVATEDRLRKPGWWPTKGSFSANSYAGTDVCARCHGDLVAIQSTTSMAKTAAGAVGSELLKQYPLSYKIGPYVYQAKRNGQTADYSVADGTKSFSTSLQWAFGIRMGQSFLFERNGGIFMAPLTYYPEYSSWDFTVDQPHAVPDSLEKALGRHLIRQRGAGMFQLPQYRLYNQRPV